MIKALQERGMVYFRWGFFSEETLDLPKVGEKVVMACSISGKTVLFLMKVIAKGDDCIPFLDNPDIIRYPDDIVTFVLTNVVGPVTADTERLDFLGPESLDTQEIYDQLDEFEHHALIYIFDNELKKWWPPNNIDMDLSIDDQDIR